MPDPNNVLLERQRLAVQVIPKAANTAIKGALARALGLLAPNPNAPGVFDYGSRADVMGLGADWLVVTVVRHPLDRLVSCWADKVAYAPKVRPHLSRNGARPGMPFQAFAAVACATPDGEADQHFRAQAHDIGSLHETRADLIMRLEDGAEGWGHIQEAVRKHCGLRLPPLGQENSSERGAWDMYYSGILEACVERYRDDFALGDYPIPGGGEVPHG